jgi:chloramphenicol-sensitive protein RarD
MDNPPPIKTGSGYGYALATYSFWGVAPVYFVLVKFATPTEVLAHRVIWSLPLLAVLITLARQWPAVRALNSGQLARLAVCAVLLSINWLTFIYAIHSERIVETSLGYFINPLVSIVLGSFFLKEKMRLWQWVATAMAALGVATELVALGDLPWLGLTLAFSFGFYGLMRKQLGIPSSVGLGVEATLVAPFAIGFLLYGISSGDIGTRSVNEFALLGLGGVVTVVPLVWFAAAAIRLPLTTLGFFQYLAPSISLILAVYLYGESVPDVRWLSFGLIWLGLVILSTEGLYHHRYKARGEST